VAFVCCRSEINDMSILSLARFFSFVFMVSSAFVACGAEYELVVRNGRVIDGTGNPAFFADVAVQQGRIVRVGRVDGRGAEEIDAAGLVVTPGFIDVHTHADEVAEMPRAENFVRMGVTTVVAGNCGSSTLDFEKFFRDIEAQDVAVNVASLVGHGDVRRKAMGGSFNRPPSTEEMEQMKDLVDKAMKAGAVGLSTGLIYLPGTFAKTEEIVELAKVVARYDGIYASHMRHEDARILKAIEEVVRIAREAKVRAEISHIKLGSPKAWGRATEVLNYIEQARAEGLDITQDQYAYTASSTSIGQLVPDFALEGGRNRLKERLEDPAVKIKVVAWMKENLISKGREDYAYAVISSCDQDPALNGLNIPQASKRLRGADSLDDQIETVLQIQANGGASGVFHGMNEEDLKTFMRHPNTMVACDSGLRKFGEGVPHPRGYGNNARVLAKYVRDEHVLRLEDAIRKMTSLPAGAFQLKNRGLLKEGNFADITVFDPGKVRDVSTFEDPHHYAEGFLYVIVNGVPVIERGQHTGAKAGRPLRHDAAGAREVAKKS
jgi:N-acyl-D-amino-acid deacylase